MLTDRPPVYFCRVHPNVEIPAYSTAGAVGMDIRACIPDTHFTLIQPGQRALIKTGLKMAFPVGWYCRVAPRSGLALNHGIDVLAGVIDSDYRGEIGVILVNHSSVNFRVNNNDRIAQLIMERADRAVIEEIPADIFAATPTARGDGGFGSTGTS